jgi:hypothetical protein
MIYLFCGLGYLLIVGIIGSLVGKFIKHGKGGME